MEGLEASPGPEGRPVGASPVRQVMVEADVSVVTAPVPGATRPVETGSTHPEPPAHTSGPRRGDLKTGSPEPRRDPLRRGGWTLPTSGRTDSPLLPTGRGAPESDPRPKPHSPIHFRRLNPPTPETSPKDLSSPDPSQECLSGLLRRDPRSRTLSACGSQSVRLKFLCLWFSRVGVFVLGRGSVPRFLLFVFRSGSGSLPLTQFEC